MTIPRENRGFGIAAPSKGELIAIQRQEPVDADAANKSTAVTYDLDTQENVKILPLPRQSRGFPLVG